MEIQIPCEKKLELLDIPTLSSVPNRRAGTLIKFEEKFPPKRCFSWNKKEIRILIYQLAGQFHPTLLFGTLEYNATTYLE